MGYFAKRLNEFSIGQFIISKIQWTVSFIILFKLFDVSWYIYIITVPVLLLITWGIGVFIHRSGLWNNYVKESLKKGLE